MRPAHLATRYKYELSPRQREVMDLLARGLTNAEIADRLGVSLDGAKYHVREILGKLNAGSREEAVQIWRELPARQPVWRRFGAASGMAGKLAVAAAGTIGLVAAVIVVVALVARADHEPGADPALEPTVAPTTIPTPAATPSTLAACTSQDVTLTFETVARADDVLVRLSAAGTTPCRLLGPMMFGLIRPPVDPGPNYPPEANIARDLKIAMDFPFSGVIGEWSWKNWCAQPMTFIAWQAKQIESSVQGFLGNEKFPPCIDEGGPTTLSRERYVTGLEGDSTADSRCRAAGFAEWLCTFATSAAVDAANGRLFHFPRGLSNDAYFLCDGSGGAPGLPSDSAICLGAEANTSVQGFWLANDVPLGTFVAPDEFEAEVQQYLLAAPAVLGLACADGDAACSRFAIVLGGEDTHRTALLYRLEPGREPAIIGEFIGRSAGDGSARHAVRRLPVYAIPTRELINVRLAVSSHAAPEACAG